MENASKALLIAAAVLIVILLIAFGMRIFQGTTDVQGQADQVGAEIVKQSDQAGTAAKDAISGLEIPTKAPTNP